MVRVVALLRVKLQASRDDHSRIQTFEGSEVCHTFFSPRKNRSRLTIAKSACDRSFCPQALTFLLVVHLSFKIPP